jgi:hypothetical protein
MRRVTAGVLVGLAVGWFASPGTVVTETVVRLTPLPNMAGDPGTPIADSLVDWDDFDRQSDCLFEWLQGQVGWEITLERVLAAGYWTDALGGACLLIGEDDE